MPSGDCGSNGTDHTPWLRDGRPRVACGNAETPARRAQARRVRPQRGAHGVHAGLTLICQVASGVVNAALGREAVASVPAGRTAKGSGANNTARSGPAGLLQGFDTALIVSAAFSLLGALAILTCRPRHTSPSEATVETTGRRRHENDSAHESAGVRL
jgi:hypothetical protein